MHIVLGGLNAKHTVRVELFDHGFLLFFLGQCGVVVSEGLERHYLYAGCVGDFHVVLGRVVNLVKCDEFLRTFSRDCTINCIPRCSAKYFHNTFVWCKIHPTLGQMEL